LRPDRGGIADGTLAALSAVGGALSLCACVTTSLQGYADRELPVQPVTHVAALVSAPLPLSESLQANIAEQVAKIGIVVDDARTILQPTRQYTDAEIKRDLVAQGVGAVLVVTVGDSSVVRKYAGTVFSGSYSGTTTANFGGVTYGGTSTGVASPAYRFRRQTDFSARLDRGVEWPELMGWNRPGERGRRSVRRQRHERSECGRIDLRRHASERGHRRGAELKWPLTRLTISVAVDYAVQPRARLRW